MTAIKRTLTERGWRRVRTALTALLLATAVAVLALYRVYSSHKTQPALYPATLSQILQLPQNRLPQVTISRMNLLCATDLSPHSAALVDKCEDTIALWADRVRSETGRHLYRFQRNPAEFENSPAYFRMLMLTVVLAEDFGVRYDPTRAAGPAASQENDGFFSDPQSVFLDGLLGPKRLGTCSSLPVLYVAVGRHLGYPLKLVTTKGHLFVRWDGDGERFNVEATAHGLCRFDDDYYRHWPFEVSAAEEAAEGYLKSLTPPQELAVFLSIRGMCLREQGLLREAADAFASAARLAPACHEYRRMFETLEAASQQAALRPDLPLTTTPEAVKN